MADSNSNSIPDSLEPDVNTQTGLSTLPVEEVQKASKSFQAEQAAAMPTGVPQDQLKNFEMQVLDEGNQVDPAAEFDVIDAEDRLAKVSGKDLKTVLSSGVARLVSAEQKSQIENEAKYGNKGVQAAALGAARGLSFGLSDQALKESGAYEGSELAGIESANKAASIGGEITGAIAPALLSGGTTAVASGARAAGAAIRATEAIGAKVAAKATASLIKSGVSAGAAKQIALKMLPDIVDLGVQGAAQGIGRLTTENAFGTADFNAQNLIAYAGMGSLVGGTFGVVMGGGRAIAPAVKSVIGKGVDAADNLISKGFNREATAAELSNINASGLVRAEAKNPKFLSDLADNFTTIFDKYKTKTAEDFYKAVDTEHASLGSEIGSIYKKSSEAGSRSTGEEVGLTIRRKLDEHLSRMGDAVSDAERERLFKVGDEYISKISKKGEVDAVDLHGRMQELQNIIYPKAADGRQIVKTIAEESTAGVQRAIRQALKEEATTMVSRADNMLGLTKEGSLAANLADKNKKFSVLSEVHYNADKALAKEKLSGTIGKTVKDLTDFQAGAAGLMTGNPAVYAGVLGAKKLLKSHELQKAVIMGKLQMAQMRTSAAINRVANSIGTVGAKIATGADDAAFRHLTSFALSKNNGKKPENDQEAYTNISNNLNKLISDPEATLKSSNQNTAAMFEHAPDTAAKIDASYLAAMQYLNSKVKKSSKKKGAFDMNKSDAMPTLEISKMKRYMEAVEDPMSVLKKASKGKINREGVDVLKNLYPDIYRDMQIKVLDKVHKSGKNLSYQEKLNLGLLLGVNAHETTDYANLMNLQAIIASPGTSAQETAYSPARMDNFKKAEKMETVTQEKGVV